PLSVDRSEPSRVQKPVIRSVSDFEKILPKVCLVDVLPWIPRPRKWFDDYAIDTEHLLGGVAGMVIVEPHRRCCGGGLNCKSRNCRDRHCKQGSFQHSRDCINRSQSHIEARLQIALLTPHYCYHSISMRLIVRVFFTGPHIDQAWNTSLRIAFTRDSARRHEDCAKARSGRGCVD